MQAKSISAKAKEFWEKAKTIKNIEVIIAVIVIGIVLLIYASTLPTDKSKKLTAEQDFQVTASDVEQRLAEILSQIDGAGRVCVMITYESTDHSMEVGNQESTSLKIKGVIIVAEGADDIGVKLNLIRATQTVLAIKANTIEVFVMKNK